MSLQDSQKSGSIKENRQDKNASAGRRKGLQVEGIRAFFPFWEKGPIMPFLFGVFDFWAFALVSDFDVWVSDF
jgi:hypothetical protein